jgi:hypothetical protein
MDETPLEFVKSFATQRLQANQSSEAEVQGDAQAIFDEKLRYKVLVLEPSASSKKKKPPKGNVSKLY